MPDRQSLPPPWAPPLEELRLVGDGRTVGVLAVDARLLWWCCPDVDSPPLCWQLLDADGGVAAFEDLHWHDSGTSPAGPSATTVLRGADGLIEVRDALLPEGDGTLLVRLLRRRSEKGPADEGRTTVRHRLRLGGFDSAVVGWEVIGGTATGTHTTADKHVPLRAEANRHRLDGDSLVSEVDLRGSAWQALVVGVAAPVPRTDADALHERVSARERQELQRLGQCLLPRRHPERALDALAVMRACTYQPTGAVVAAPTTSLPEAPGHDRQFDYRYTWLRDASLSTAVAALLGRPDDARRYLDFVHRAWGDKDLLTRPLLTVRGEDVPAERHVDGVSGWGGSLPVRVGNDAGQQRQYDALGLFAEGVSVHLQVGGRLDGRTWELVRRLADQVAAEDAGEVVDSNGIWEMREQLPLVDGDIGRWLVLDRALWIARGWRPWTRRAHWKRARDTIARRITAGLTDEGVLPQAYGQQPPVPDASALMAVAFGLLERDDPRAHTLVDGLLARLGAGPFLHRYPPGGDDGFRGVEGAFLPVSFLAVTALASLGRTEEATARLNHLCAALPRLLSEEVDPQTGRLLGNTPLVWSHAELARAVYVLDAALRRQQWGRAGLWAWRLQRYLRLRHSTASGA